ncbi:MAG: hypothetical protein RIR86_3204 [Acidobacteriota bacterium]
MNKQFRQTLMAIIAQCDTAEAGSKQRQVADLTSQPPAVIFPICCRAPTMTIPVGAAARQVRDRTSPFTVRTDRS